MCEFPLYNFSFAGSELPLILLSVLVFFNHDELAEGVLDTTGVLEDGERESVTEGDEEHVGLDFKTLGEDLGIRVSLPKP